MYFFRFQIMQEFVRLTEGIKINEELTNYLQNNCDSLKRQAGLVDSNGGFTIQEKFTLIWGHVITDTIRNVIRFI